MISVLLNQNTGKSGTTTFIYIRGLHVSTYTQVIFRHSCTYESIKSYARMYRRVWRWPAYGL